MSIIVCPGIHDPKLTQSFLDGLKLSSNFTVSQTEDILVFPTQNLLAYSSADILQFLCRNSNPVNSSPLIFISFSAGVAGAIGSAWGWQLLGGKVKAFMALDGWGVPLYGNFPIYRLSHDYFTHWSSALLGNGQDAFYADSPVEHLDLWRSPQTTQGWQINSNTGKSAPQRTPTTAALFLVQLLQRYLCSIPTMSRN